MNVLMATDGSLHASCAMLAAARMLRSKGTPIDVVSVAPLPNAWSKRSDSRLFQIYKEHLAAPAKRTLEEAQHILDHADVKARTLLAFGSPAEQILILAKNYVLTVVGAYGGHDRSQPGMGTVSIQVLQSSAGNVMVGRELVNEENFRVLVALDSSEASAHALRMLPALFSAEALDVTLMHVMETAWADFASGDTSLTDLDSCELPDYQSQLRREFRKTADATMEAAQQFLNQWSIGVTPIIKEGEPALEICSEAENGGYDLVVLGATGVSDVRHARLGSVSLKVAWDAPCSVAVFRPAI